MYWPTASARRILLSPAGLNVLPPTTDSEASAAYERHAAALSAKRGIDTDTFPDQRNAGDLPGRPRSLRRSSTAPDAPSSSSLASGIAAAIAAEEREQLVDMSRSPDGLYFACLSAHTLSIWTHRPTQAVAAIRRTRASVVEHGRSCRVFWATPSADVTQPRRLAIQTDQHVLLLYRVLEPREGVYAYAPVLPDSQYLPPGPRRVHSHSRSISLSGLSTPRPSLVSASGERYAPTPQSMINTFSRTAGEIPHPHSNLWNPSARPPQSKEITQALEEHNGAARAGSANADLVELEFSLAMQIDAGLRGCTATEDHLIVATSDPPAIQIIPWPSDADGTGPDKTHTTLIRKMPWLEVHPPAGEPRAKPSTNIAPRGHAVPYVNGTASIDPEPGFVIAMEHSPSMGLHIWLTSDGRAHSAYLTYEAKTAAWVGHTFHGASKSPTSESKSSPTPAPHLVSSKGKDRAGHAGVTDPGPLPPGRQATTSAINAPFALVAIGTRSGTVEVYSYQLGGSTSFSHSVSLPESSGSALGQVTSLAWTSDGHALAVGYARGWIVCSTYGRILSSSYRDSWVGIHRRFKDDHLFGVARLFWALGNNEVVLLARTDASAPDTEAKPFDPDAQLFALPFVRSVQSTFSGGASAASSGFGLLHAGEKLILYRGQELSEWQVIAPDAATEPSAMRPGRSSATAFGEGAAQGQAWQHIRLPSRYLAFNWPIRIAAPSQDGGWLAIAGRRGFAVSCLTPTAHAQAYGSSGPTSGSLRPGQDALGVGKWRLFDGDHMRQEQAFAVRGGLGWFGHFVVVAADAAGEAQLRVYDATSSLDNSHLLAVQRVPAPIVLMRIYPDASNANAGSFTGQSTGASILLYTTANSLYHLRLTFLGRVMRHPQLFMGNPSAQQETYSAPSVILKTVSNISLDSVVSEPTRVRGLDWLVAPDLPLLKPREALNKATLIFLINGKLVLLRPRVLTSVPLPSLRSSADASKSPDVTTSAVASYGPAVSASAPVASKIDFSEKIGNDLTFAQDANGHSIPEPDAVPSDGAAVPPTESPAPQASTPRLTSALSTSQVVTVTSSINTAPRLTSESAITLPKPQAQITYDTHILTEQVEFVWTTSTLTGAPKALNNTLWAYVEGRGLRVWKETGQQGQLSAHAATSGLTPSPSSLTNSDTASQPSNEASDLVRPLLPHVGTFLPLDFYPLCLLAVRGVVVGMESSLTLRKSLDFGLWRTRTATHLFLPGLLRHFLNAGEHSDASEAVDTAVRFARPYATLGYFPHALEILLHSVLEDTADGGPSPATSAATSTSPASSIPSTPFLAKFGTELQSLNCSRLDSSSKKHQSRAAYQAAQGAEELRRTVELVNSFPNNLDVIANCARKTEAARWPILFDAVGAPGDLLSAALRNGETRTAAAFLLVVFSFKSDEAEPAAVALIRATVARGEYARALDVLRFLATVKPDDPQLAARIVRQSDFLVKKPSISEQAASSQPDATMLYDTESSAGRISEPSS